jgi:hypothetical protein
MLSSTDGAANTSAAANMLTEIVFPKRRGVDTRISCDRFAHECVCSTLW